MPEQPILFLDGDTVAGLLDPAAIEAAVATALIELSAGRTSSPPRIAPTVAERGAQLLVMAAHLPASGALATKTVAIFPANAALGRPTRRALIVLHAVDDGRTLAIIGAEQITAVRTAAATAPAMRHLARDDAAVLAVLGSGVQARAHLTALSAAREFAELRIAGRSEAHREALVAAVEHELNVPVVACHCFEEAVSNADVVCLATHAAEPLLSSSCSPGRGPGAVT